MMMMLMIKMMVRGGYIFDGLVVEDYDCDGNVVDDDDLGVTLVYKDTNMDFVCDFKKTRKYLSTLLE